MLCGFSAHLSVPHAGARVPARSAAAARLAARQCQVERSARLCKRSAGAGRSGPCGNGRRLPGSLLRAPVLGLVGRGRSGAGICGRSRCAAEKPAGCAVRRRRQAMNMEKHGRGAEQAWQMLDTFGSLGVSAFDLTQTDIDGRKCGFRSAESLLALRRWMPRLLQSAIQRQHNVIVRPRRATVELVQLDDLSGVMLARLTAAAFLILATSAGNYQAWVAGEKYAADFVR